jgi:glyoxylase-like metal-dependent hydrolase (beta-lactamase superfamily II)
MSHTRRDVLRSIASTALTAGLAPMALAAASESGLGRVSSRTWHRQGAHGGPRRAARPAFVFEWKDLGSPDGPIFCRGGFGEGGNSLAVIQRGVGAVLADTKNSPFGSLLAQDLIALDEVPVDKLQSGAQPAPLKLVINTHHHYDHTGGNHAFAGKVDHLAHPNAIERIKSQTKLYQDNAAATIRKLASSGKPEDKGRSNILQQEFGDKISGWTAADFTPTRPLKGQKEGILIGGIKLELHHFGAGHTDNDIIIRVADLNVIHMGDVLFNNVWPYFDVKSGATSAGWINACQRAYELCDKDTVILPGHGDPTDREALKRQIALFEDLAPKAAAAVKSGMSREDFQKSATPGYEDYALADRLRPVTLGGLYDEAKAKAG